MAIDYPTHSLTLASFILPRTFCAILCWRNMHQAHNVQTLDTWPMCWCRVWHLDTWLLQIAFFLCNLKKKCYFITKILESIRKIKLFSACFLWKYCTRCQCSIFSYLFHIRYDFCIFFLCCLFNIENCSWCKIMIPVWLDKIKTFYLLRLILQKWYSKEKMVIQYLAALHGNFHSEIPRIGCWKVTVNFFVRSRFSLRFIDRVLTLWASVFDRLIFSPRNLFFMRTTDWNHLVVDDIITNKRSFFFKFCFFVVCISRSSFRQRHWPDPVRVSLSIKNCLLDAAINVLVI